MKNPKKLQLAIVGHGFVGKATESGFNRNVNKIIIDPLLNTKIEDLKDFDADIVFICVPTPMGDDGSQDPTIIENVIQQLSVYSPSSIKVIKSTVLPSILEELEELDKKLIYNPEFLREKHANSDFINSQMLIFGGKKNISIKVSKAYKKHSKCSTTKHIFTDLKTASLIKYTINSFLASKVIFFNELYSVFEKLNVSDSWDSFISAVSNDTRIGLSHMNVPGHDGRKGFGGACFPKDCLALAKYAQSLEVELSLIRTAIKTNNKIRSAYEDLDLRETAQNVTFDDKI
ncbi:MAG: hypothetical protein CMM96_00745 [Rickettsiales bacterium]|nr:hypothetical protein [Rickettsiales bacterium]|tara:strand:+ start:7257 stop:8120 length:864 start_codon:yes stop_codon:yes gene_type:complete